MHYKVVHFVRSSSACEVSSDSREVVSLGFHSDFRPLKSICNGLAYQLAYIECLHTQHWAIRMDNQKLKGFTA